MKYRVTTRGWIVFSILGLLLVMAIFVVGNALFNSPDIEKDNNSIVNEVIDTQGSELEDAFVKLDLTNTSESEVVTDDTASESGISEKDSDLDSDQTTSDKETDSVEKSDVLDVEIIEVDMSIRTEIIFDKNAADLAPQFYDALNEWIGLLDMNQSLTVTIEGHINGYPDYNDGTYGLAISNDRALSVKSYLIEHNIDEPRIRIVNKGSNEQAIKTDDITKHYLNRRAIIYLNKN